MGAKNSAPSTILCFYFIFILGIYSGKLVQAVEVKLLEA
jgi:hypothetical protein